MSTGRLACSQTVLSVNSLRTRSDSLSFGSMPIDVKLGDAIRTAELRQRHLAVIVDGLRAGHHTPVPGAPPT